MNINAKTELLDTLASLETKVKCASVDGKTLRVNYSDVEWKEFLHDLDFIYNCSYDGCQEIPGTVWLKNGTWLSRGEYDGREGWIHNSCPEIPNDLL
jgi:hypothetical protein